jgi:hypothetical protein
MQTFSGQLRHIQYAASQSQEHCLCLGPLDAARRIIILPPLFDEMNRMRRTLVQAMRSLAERGIASCLPDLPGCNDSLSPLDMQSIESWCAAVLSASQAFGATHVFSMRGGCLLDDAARLPAIRLAPIKGASLIKTLVRAQIASDKEAGITSTSDALAQKVLSGSVHLSGYTLSAQLWSDLESAVPAGQTVQEIALDTIAGSALWLRAEPDYSADMAAALARVLDEWSQSA